MDSNACLCYTNNRIFMMAAGYVGAIAIIAASMAISARLNNKRTTFTKDAIVFISYASMCAYLFHRVVIGCVYKYGHLQVI